jgi:hypothetical protein
VKRHSAFHDLSRDHHRILLRALELRRGQDPAPIARRLLQTNALEHHLAEEEQILLPLIKVHPDGHMHYRRLEERNQILRAAIAGLQTPNGPMDAATLLHDHARWCEDELFPWMESQYTEPVLQDLGRKSVSFRHAAGAPIGPGAACQL